ncbi:MAG: Gldg family protein [Pirellulales bacterium]
MMLTLYEAAYLLIIDILFFAVLGVAISSLAMQRRAAFAVLKRNFVGYFINPTGYAFLCLFVLLTSVAAFCPDDFFNSNLANLEQLNKYAPYIMLVFIPAITMSIWAEERRQGTDELLLTLPATDIDIVVGKYLAAAAIFTVSLVFSQISHFTVLAALTEGDLDTRFLCATYLGYWFVGLGMLSLGMVASFLTSNLTVGFILGALFNAPLAFAADADVILPTALSRGVSRWSLGDQFADFGRGIVSLSSVTYFVMVIVLGLYLSVVLIGRRHWSGGRDGTSLLGHFCVRAVALIVIAMGLNVFFGNHDARLDATQNKVNKLSADTRRILASLDPKRPVVIDAFIGSEIPEDYVKTRVELLSMLKEFQSVSGGKVQVRIQENVEPTSEIAVQAEKRFGIRPQTVRTQSRGVFKDVPVILGAAVTSGLEKVVVPFFDYGIPVEYELVRSISTASRGSRKKLGIVRTDAQLMGGFSFAGGQPQNIPKSAIIDELEKQYDVEEVDPTSKIEPGRFDVLVVVQPSSLGPAELENLVDVVRRGQPTAIFEDPLPVMDEMRFVPGTGQPKRQNPMAQMFGGGPPPPKGDITRLWQTLGVECAGERGGPSPMGGPPGYDAYIVWQRFNPYKKVQVSGFTNEFVFIRPEVPGEEDPFNGQDAVSSGIEELLFPMPGGVSKAKDSDIEFTPLVQTGNRAGTISFQNWQANQESPSLLQIAEGPTRGKFVIAARIKGKGAVAAEADASKKAGEDASKAGDAAGATGGWQDKPLNVIYVTDIDLMASAFVRIRAQPDQMFRWRFENVTFALNVIDALSGEDSYLEIRKRKTKYSTLTVIEKQSEAARNKEQEERAKFEEDYAKAVKKAEDESKESLKKLEESRASIEERKRKGEAVDPKEEEAITIQFLVQQQLAQQKLDTERTRLKNDRDARIKESARRLEQQIDRIQDSFKTWAVTLPLIPPLLVGLAVFVRRRLREREGISKARLI